MMHLLSTKREEIASLNVVDLESLLNFGPKAYPFGKSTNLILLKYVLLKVPHHSASKILMIPCGFLCTHNFF
jgi:hypothetical protein